MSFFSIYVKQIELVLKCLMAQRKHEVAYSNNKEWARLLKLARINLSKCCADNDLAVSENGIRVDWCLSLNRNFFTRKVELSITCPHCDAVILTYQGEQLKIRGLE